MNWRWLAGVGIALAQLGLACPDPQAVIVPAYPVPPYSEVAQLVSASLERRGVPVAVAGAARASACPKLWIALGSEAAAKVRAQDPVAPLLLGLVLDAESIFRFAPATGVFLEHPISVRWRTFRRLFPWVRHLALVYDPRFADRLAELERLAQAEGVFLTKLPVADGAELSRALSRLPEEVEAVWPIGNGHTFSLLAARPLFLFAQRRRLVLIGLSARWVEAGAAYALDWDWPRLAEQLAELAWALWQGDSPQSHPPQSPCCARLVTRWESMTEPMSGRLP